MDRENTLRRYIIGTLVIFVVSYGAQQYLPETFPEIVSKIQSWSSRWMKDVNLMFREIPPLKIPKRLEFGAGTAAFLVEGAMSTNGRGEGYLEKFVLTNQTSSDLMELPEISSDSYHQYKQDVRVAKDIGLKFYQFSISWTRLLPTGYTNIINQEGVQYYSNLIDELKRVGVEPMIVLNYFDHPAVFEKSGGWQNETMVDLFRDYARVVFDLYADRVKYYLTFNEPNLLCHLFDMVVTNTKELKLSFPRNYVCSNNVLKAHAEVYHLYHSEYNEDGKGKVSINLQCNDFVANNADDDKSAEVAFAFGCDWFAHPIFSDSGDYSKLMKNHINEFIELREYDIGMPSLSDYWVKRIWSTADFFSFSYYSTLAVAFAPEYATLTWHNFFVPEEARLLLSEIESSPEPDIDPDTIPWKGLRSLLNKINNRYDSPAIHVVDCGYFDGGELDDIERIKHIHGHVKEIINAINYEKCDVRGYTFWTLIDGYEFWSDYDKTFGLAHVDFKSPRRTRTLKESGKWLRDALSKKSFPLDV